MVLHSVWEWRTCISFSSKYSPLFFFRPGKGEEAAALQSTLRGLLSHVFVGFGRMAAGRAQKCACRGVLIRWTVRYPGRLALFSVCICAFYSQRTPNQWASSSFYFLLKYFSQRNVQLVELLIYVSTVSVYWALTEASAPCLISDLPRNFISCCVLLARKSRQHFRRKACLSHFTLLHLVAWLSLAHCCLTKSPLGSGSIVKSSKIYDFNCLALWQ